MNDVTVYLQPPAKEWVKQFERQKALLENHDHPFIQIEHIGSTSIGTIHAKPIVDLGAAIQMETALCTADYELLAKHGYVFHPHASTKERLFFKKEYDNQIFHLHVMEYESEEWRNKIAFRDELRKNKQLAKQYEQLKFKLAKSHDRPAYTEAKGPFIQNCLEQIKKRNM